MSFERMFSKRPDLIFVARAKTKNASYKTMEKAIDLVKIGN